MTLKDKFQQWFINDEEDEHYEGMVELVSIEHEKLADEHAIDFRDFCNKRANEKPLSNVGLSSKELLEIYKKEKGLWQRGILDTMINGTTLYHTKRNGIVTIIN